MYRKLLYCFFIFTLFIVNNAYAMEENKYIVSQIMDSDVSKVESLKLEFNNLRTGDKYFSYINDKRVINELLEGFMNLKVEQIDEPQENILSEIEIVFLVGQMKYIYNSSEGFCFEDLTNNRKIIARYVVSYSDLINNIEIQNLKWIASEEKTANQFFEEEFCKFTIGSNKVYLEGEELLIDNNPLIVPFITENTQETMVPLRCLAENFGYVIEWDQESNQAILKISDFRIEITERKKNIVAKVTKNRYTLENENEQTLWKKEFCLKTEPCIIEDRIFVPLRFISEILNFKVSWDEEKMDIHIKKREEKEYVQSYPCIEKKDDQIIVGLRTYTTSQIPIIMFFENKKQLEYDIYNSYKEKVQLPEYFFSDMPSERIIYPQEVDRLTNVFKREYIDDGIYYADICFANNRNYLYRILFDNQ